jgi:hypothetical protein
VFLDIWSGINIIHINSTALYSSLILNISQVVIVSSCLICVSKEYLSNMSHLTLTTTFHSIYLIENSQISTLVFGVFNLRRYNHQVKDIYKDLNFIVFDLGTQLPSKAFRCQKWMHRLHASKQRAIRGGKILLLSYLRNRDVITNKAVWFMQ